MSENVYIYAIQHNKTKKIYIGQSVDPERRCSEHILNLRNGRSIIEDMENDFREYGEDYSFFILEEVKNEKLVGNDGRMKKSGTIAEYKWMEKLKTTDREVGYNYKDRAAITYINKGFRPLIEFSKGIPKPINKKEV